MTPASASPAMCPEPKFVCRSAPESNSSRRVVGVDEVDAAGDGAHLVDDGAEVVAAGVRVAGVEAEADLVAAGGRGDGVPEPGDRPRAWRAMALSPPAVFSMRSGTGRSRPSIALAPVVEPLGGVLVVAQVAAVDDDALGADLGGGRQVLLEQLAAGDADAVVEARDVDRVGRVDVEVDPRSLRVGLERGRPAGVPDDRPLVALRVAEEELRAATPRAPAPRRSGRSWSTCAPMCRAMPPAYAAWPTPIPRDRVEGVQGPADPSTGRGPPHMARRLA